MADVADMMPDPAAAPGAGSVKEPRPITFGQLVPQDIPEGSQVDPDQFVCMVVTAGDHASRCKPPASFMYRAAYQQLAEEGCVELPNSPGVGIYHHNQTCQWHAVFNNQNFAPSWGAIRSERKALLSALHAIWEWFCAQNPNMAAAKQHLDMLTQKLQETSF